MINTASDIYSLGAIFYELVGGRRAHQFTNRTPAEMERVVCEEDPPSLAGKLGSIARMAMHKEPHLRYASVERLSDDVSRYLEGQPVLARRGAGLYRVRKFVGRNKLPVVTSAVALLSLVSAIAVWKTQGTASLQVRPITALPGSEVDPDLSPDGNRVVFRWRSGSHSTAEASIRTVDPSTGATDMLARGLTAVTDIACSGASRVIAAEFTLDLTVLAPSGRIKVIEGGAARVVGLISQVSRSIPVRVRFTPLAWKARSSGSPRRRHLGIAFAGDWSERVVERRTQPPRARSEENTIFKSVDLGWKTWRLPALSMSGLSGRSWANWCSSALLRNSRSPAGCVQRFGHFRHCSARVRDLGTANKAFRTAFLGARDYFWRRLRSTTALNRRDEGGGGASGLRRTTASGGRVPS